MRKLRSAIWLSGLTLVLLGSIVVSEFSHSCHEDGDLTSYIVAIDDHCKSKAIYNEPCCESESHSEAEGNSHTDEHDCCSDEIKILKLNLDYFQDIQDVAFVANYNKDIGLPKVASTNKDIQPHNYANPPPLSRSERITQHQVWLI